MGDSHHFNIHLKREIQGLSPNKQHISHYKHISRIPYSGPAPAFHRQQDQRGVVTKGTSHSPVCRRARPQTHVLEEVQEGAGM